MFNTASFQQVVQLIQIRNFRFFIFVRFALIFAVFAQHTVISYHLFQITKDPLSLGLLGLAEVIPAFLFSLPAGYLADKYDKRKMYLWCTVVYLIISILFYIITYPSIQAGLSIPIFEKIIYVLIFINGIARATLAPASFALLPQLIKREKYTQAITWSTSSWYLGSVLGPLMGGLLLSRIGVNKVFIVVIVFIIVSMILMYAINTKSEESKIITENIPILESLKQGLRFVFKTQIVLAVLSLDLFAVLFGGAEAMLPAFANNILDVGAWGYGWLRSAHGIGSIFLTILMAFLPLRKNVGIKMLLSVLGFGICIILFGLSKNFYLSFAILFLAGMFDNVSVIIRHSILQLKTPEELKGRVASVNSIFISSSNELGAFESGVAAKFMGLVPSVVFGGIMTTVVVIIIYFLAPQLKKLKF